MILIYNIIYNKINDVRVNLPCIFDKTDYIYFYKFGVYKYLSISYHTNEYQNCNYWNTYKK